MNNAFFAFLAEEDVEYKRNVSLKENSSIKIGGVVSCVIYPDTTEKLVMSVEKLIFYNIRWKIIGRLTNLLLSFDFYDGVLISTSRLNRISLMSGCASAECGVSYSSFLLRALEYGHLADVELFGIPGSIGGMIYSNAGAYNKEIAESILDVTVYSPREKRVLCLNKSSACFDYRYSRFKNTDEVILKATLRLTDLNGVDAMSLITNIKKKRRNTQPLEYPSLGSVFKRYNGVSAGYYIDRAGLKGFSVGGAMVSPKHAGFIVNTGDATADDYISVVRIVKEAVYNKFKIMLEEEIEYILPSS